jgi:hypothetical protein
MIGAYANGSEKQGANLATIIAKSALANAHGRAMRLYARNVLQHMGTNALAVTRQKTLSYVSTTLMAVGERTVALLAPAEVPHLFIDGLKTEDGHPDFNFYVPIAT